MIIFFSRGENPNMLQQSNNTIFQDKASSLYQTLERERLNMQYLKGEISLDKFKESVKVYRIKKSRQGI